MKTGYTKEAGYGLVGSAVQNGVRLIVVVNGFKTAKERADEAKQAAGMGLQGLRVARMLFAEGETVGRGQGLSAARRAACRWSRKGAVKLMVPRGISDKISQQNDETCNHEDEHGPTKEAFHGRLSFSSGSPDATPL